MRISMRDAQPVSEMEITQFEEIALIRLPDDYRSFLLDYNGAMPEGNIFRYSNAELFNVRRFIPLDELLSIKHRIGDLLCEFLPVAYDSCGNYVCLDLDAGGEVFFWDHEEPSDRLRLAPSFTAFLDMLEPFDPSTIELKPEQIKKVWVDPKFLQEQRKRGNTI